MSTQKPVKRVTPHKILIRKGGEPVVCLTAYTAPMARILDDHVDLMLVGDSAAMVLHGLDTTLPISLDIMIAHGQAVMRGSCRACVIVDMPFGSYEESPEVAFRNASRILRETGCSGVKLEGGVTMAETIRFLTNRGVPVLAHVGLMPQAINMLGSYRARGRRRIEWAQIEADATAVAEAGAFGVVLEGMAEPLAAKITKALSIPTIGIGASPTCDGQILVTEDMLGHSDSPPPFVKRYARLGAVIEEAVAHYAADVRERKFPAPEHTFPVAEDEE